jgi:hypothetical protein
VAALYALDVAGAEGSMVQQLPLAIPFKLDKESRYGVVSIVIDKATCYTMSVAD